MSDSKLTVATDTVVDETQKTQKVRLYTKIAGAGLAVLVVGAGVIWALQNRPDDSVEPQSSDTTETPGNE